MTYTKNNCVATGNIQQLYHCPNRAYTTSDREKITIKRLLKALEGTLIDFKVPKLFDKYTIFFITLNPRIDSSSWCTDIRKINKKWRKKNISYSVYNYEFSTQNKTKYRFHSHGLIFLKKYEKKSQLGKKWILTNKGFMLNIFGDKQKIDIKPVNNSQTLIRYLSYLAGLKQESKERDVQEDKRIRRQHFKPALPDYYQFQNPLYNNTRLHNALSVRLKEMVDGSKLSEIVSFT